MKQEEEGEIVFNKQSVFGFKLATDGYGITYELGKFKSNRRSILYQFELSEKKHKKEKKTSLGSNGGWQMNYVVYGKENNFYQLKLGIAMQQVLGGKGNKNGVSVAAVYGGGLTVGLLKPYYFDVQDSAGQRTRKKNEQLSQDKDVILGSSGFTVGWNELKIKPGLYGKAALRFDYGRLKETVTAIEVGLAGEYYAGKIAQMAANKQKHFFYSAYISLLLGRRK